LYLIQSYTKTTEQDSDVLSQNQRNFKIIILNWTVNLTQHHVTKLHNS